MFWPVVPSPPMARAGSSDQPQPLRPSWPWGFRGVTHDHPTEVRITFIDGSSKTFAVTGNGHGGNLVNKISKGARFSRAHLTGGSDDRTGALIFTADLPPWEFGARLGSLRYAR